MQKFYSPVSSGPSGSSLTREDLTYLISDFGGWVRRAHLSPSCPLIIQAVATFRKQVFSSASPSVKEHWAGFLWREPRVLSVISADETVRDHSCYGASCCHSPKSPSPIPTYEQSWLSTWYAFVLFPIWSQKLAGKNGIIIYLTPSKSQHSWIPKLFSFFFPQTIFICFRVALQQEEKGSQGGIFSPSRIKKVLELQTSVIKSGKRIKININCQIH